MNIISKLSGAVLLGAGALAVSGCATGLPTQVTRYQALPAPAGQTFYVVPESGNATLEFGRFASLVAQQLEQQGYQPAGTPDAANMIVRIGYGVDQGHTVYTQDPFYRGGIYTPLGSPYWSNFGYYGARSPFFYGWNDPFWYYGGYGAGFGGRIDSYTEYRSGLDMTITRRIDHQPLFEGHVKARSQTDELGVLVPNLIQAIFTGFPGRNGETVKITVPARRG